jgi:SAM-dependent methyltransferase
VSPADPRPVAAWTAEPASWDGAVRYGPLVAGEPKLRLLGQVSARRVLALGCGQGQVVAELAGAGARTIAVDGEAAAVEATRNRCQEAGLNAEVHHRDPAELAFVRADTIDAAVSVLALSGVADLTRVFRQVHRVLRPEAPLVLSLPHPALRWCSGTTTPTPWSHDGLSGTDQGHGIEALFTALTRAGFRIDTLLELLADPDGTGAADERYRHPAMAGVPAVVVLRARRSGARATAEGR